MLAKVATLLAISLTVANAQSQQDDAANSAQQQEQQRIEQERRRQQQQQQQQQQREQQQQQRMDPTLLVSGHVLLSSGGAPAEPIRIVQICGTRRTIEGYTDSKGRFGFAAGRNEHYSNTDVTVARPGGPGAFGQSPAAGLSGCSIEADAPGYRSNSLSLWQTSGGDIGTIILTPLERGQGAAISVTSLAAPKKASDAFFKAMKEIDKGPSANLERAGRHLEKAVDEYPGYAAAWARLGQVRADSGDLDGAIAALETSAQLDERYLLPYDALVRVYMSKGDLQHARDLTQFVLSIHPGITSMRWYQAVCDYGMGRDDEALELLTAIQQDPRAAAQFPRTHQILGLIYARRGRLDEAAEAYQRYLETAPSAEVAESIRKQIDEWQGNGGL